MVKRLDDIDKIKDELVSKGRESQKSSQGRIVTKILVALVIIAMATAGWFYWKYAEVQKEVQKIITGGMTEEEMEQEIKEITAATSKLMMLPSEKPQIATVVNPDVLIEEQPFYEGVKTGDKVLYFPEAKRVIIYSPSRNLIVNAGPVYYDEEINNEQAGGQSQSRPEPEEELSIDE